MEMLYKLSHNDNDHSINFLMDDDDDEEAFWRKN